MTPAKSCASASFAEYDSWICSLGQRTGMVFGIDHPPTGRYQGGLASMALVPAHHRFLVACDPSLRFRQQPLACSYCWARLGHEALPDQVELRQANLSAEMADAAEHQGTGPAAGLRTGKRLEHSLPRPPAAKSRLLSVNRTCLSAALRSRCTGSMRYARTVYLRHERQALAEGRPPTVHLR